MTGRRAGKTSKGLSKRNQRSSSPQQGNEEGANIRREQPPAPQVVKKIIKAENEEARTLKTVFKSNPDTQMREFIQKAAKPLPQAVKNTSRTPAESHPPAVAQELLETDDDVADNLVKLFKTSKSYKNI